MTLIVPKDYESAGLVFPAEGMSISPIIRDLLYLGSTPRDGESLERFRRGPSPVLALTFLLPTERPTPRLVGCEHRHYELDDNLDDPVERPPRVRGMKLREVFDVGMHVAERMQQQKGTVVMCAQGLNRSAMIVGIALRAIHWSPDRVVDTIRTARGGHALCNRTFYAMVTAT